MTSGAFLIRKRAIFRKVKEIKALRGGVHQYAAQAMPRIDADIAEKGRFRTETRLACPRATPVEMFSLPTPITTFVRLLRDAFFGWFNDNVSRMAAAVAYYTLFSLAPLLVFAIAIASLAYSEEAARAQIIQQFQNLVGTAGTQVIENALRHARQPGGTGVAATAFSILVLLFGASNAFAQLQDSLNQIWRVQPRPGIGIVDFLRKRLLTFSMVAAVGFLLLVSLLLSAALAAAGAYLFGRFEGAILVWQGLNFIFSILVITALFALVLKILPDARIAWRDVWSGAAITALLFSLGKFLLGFYLGRGTFASAYGAAGSLVIFLAWVYYSAQILPLRRRIHRRPGPPAQGQDRPGTACRAHRRRRADPPSAPPPLAAEKVRE